MTLLTGYHFSKRNLIDACLQALPGATGRPAELDKQPAESHGSRDAGDR
jgi:hypothetical protein